MRLYFISGSEVSPFLLGNTNVSKIEQFKKSINFTIFGKVVNSRLNSHSRFVLGLSLSVIK